MKKKLLLLFAVLLTAVNASAYDFEVNGIYYNISSSNELTCYVTYKNYSEGYFFSTYSGYVTIPSSVTYNGKLYSVTEIGSSAFWGCSSLTTVTIPNTVTTIGSEAFYHCTSLTSVEIPNSVTTIGSSAFFGCTSLTAVEIPNSVTEIGNYAFQNCSSLTALVIGSSVTTIGDNAFTDCSSLTSVVIGNSVTTIRGAVFKGCSSLTSVVIPNSVTSIGDFAFYGCSSLPVENNLRYADTYLVGAVDKTLSTYSIKEGTKWIGSSAFLGCESLKSVEIPNSVTSIGDFAFARCI